MSTDARLLRLRLVNDRIKKASDLLADSDDPHVIHEALRTAMIAQQEMIEWALSLEDDNLRRFGLDTN